MIDFKYNIDSACQDRKKILQVKCMDETSCVGDLCVEAKLDASKVANIEHNAKLLIEKVRSKKFTGLSVDAILLKYKLSTQEGIALMCLAEAMMRVPDAKTIDDLISDKLYARNWGSGGGVDSLFVNAAGWGLFLTGKLMRKPKSTSNLTDVLSVVVRRLGSPMVRTIIKQVMQNLGQQFVLGESIEQAVERSNSICKSGYLFSYDMLGEAAETEEDALVYFNAYEHAIKSLSVVEEGVDLLKRPGISIKLSALYSRYEYSQRARALPVLVKRLKHLVLLAKLGHITVTVDAEEADRLDLSLQVFAEVFADSALGSWSGFGLAVQAYQKRAMHVIDWLVELSKQHKRKILVRLVKGAYWDTEIKHAQVMGYADYPVFTRKVNTDVSYIVCARRMLVAKDEIYSQFATHNVLSVMTIQELAKGRCDYEFQCLHGMGRVMYDALLASASVSVSCRMYAPVGTYKDLLSYLVRRLLENGANTSFVNQIIDSEVLVDSLVVDPVARVVSQSNHRHLHIPLPQNILGDDIVNSGGYDLTDPLLVNQLAHDMDMICKRMLGKQVVAMVAGKLPAMTGGMVDILNPADNKQCLGKVGLAIGEVVDQALDAAVAAVFNWDQVQVSERAGMLRRVADVLVERAVTFMTLLIKEAGKTWQDAVDEVREAIDFLRYYAHQAEKVLTTVNLPGPTGELNQLSMHGHGVMLCISPWNFPLAIFVGQISAALVAGNVVIAKPATQTSLVAAELIGLFYEVGISRDVLQLLVGDVDLGKSLVSDSRISGVMLTGSTQTAKSIQYALAQRSGPIIPLIAETGGQNVMLVDSTALPEQVTRDVIQSAFGSAGQRCSALRVLFIQDDVADKMVAMLKGAMQMLVLGDPVDLATDIGPVIDSTSLSNLQKHKRFLDDVGELIYQLPVDSRHENGSFFAPCAYFIKDIGVLTQEVFGPILHVVRYNKRDLDKVLASVVNTGYGLTLGVHSRIDSFVEEVRAKTRIGNTYINCQMIGAKVGCQPFGGEGLSGTGPKAGGPHYIPRLCKERTLTNNTAAVGGNAALMCLSEEL